MYQSGHRHSKRLFKFRLTWPVTLNWGKVVILMTQQELKGGVAVDSVVTWIRSVCSKIRDSMPLLASRGLHLGAKSRLYLACLCYMKARLGQ